MKKQFIIILGLSLATMMTSIFAWMYKGVFILLAIICGIYLIIKVKGTIERRERAKSLFYKILRKHKELKYVWANKDILQYSITYFEYVDSPQTIIKFYIIRSERKTDASFLRKKEKMKLKEIVDYVTGLI